MNGIYEALEILRLGIREGREQRIPEIDRLKLALKNIAAISNDHVAVSLARQALGETITRTEKIDATTE